MKAQEIDPFMLPSVSLDNFKALPKAAGVYFVRTEDGKFIYIGQTSNIRYRIGGHPRKHQFASFPNSAVRYCLVDDASDRKRIEKFFIEKFTPVLNNSTSIPDGMKTVKIPDETYQELLLMSEKTGLKMYAILQKGFQLWMVDSGFWKPGQQAPTKKARNGK